jgi:hypothetical protein
MIGAASFSTPSAGLLTSASRAAGAKWCNLQTADGDHRLAGAHDELGAEAMVMVEPKFRDYDACVIRTSLHARGRLN